MPGPPPLRDLACVIHVHSTYSDGTGTVPQIAAAAARSGVDVVLLTDHDTLEAKRRGEEGWYGKVLVLVGEEVSPARRDHYLAFGIDDEIDRSLPAAEICAAVGAQGGFGFAAHPFSRGSERLRVTGMPWSDLDCDGLHGVELWSFLTDTGEQLSGARDFVRFIARPQVVVAHPPARNLELWDELCRRRPVVAIGGVDAHQLGVRVGGRVPLRLMAYHRSFRHVRTHVLVDGEPGRESVYAALRAGRCYIALDSAAPARGFDFWAESGGDLLRMGEQGPPGRWLLRACTSRPAELRLLRDGAELARKPGVALERSVDAPGAYRVEARLDARGRERTWVISNPIYLR